MLALFVTLKLFSWYWHRWYQVDINSNVLSHFSMKPYISDPTRHHPICWNCTMWIIIQQFDMNQVFLWCSWSHVLSYFYRAFFTIFSFFLVTETQRAPPNPVRTADRPFEMRFSKVFVMYSKSASLALSSSTLSRAGRSRISLGLACMVMFLMFILPWATGACARTKLAVYQPEWMLCNLWQLRGLC